MFSPSATTTAAQLAHDYGRHGDHDGPYFLFPLLFLLGLVGLAVWLFRRRRGGGLPQTPPPPVSGGTATAMAVLQERFARGEVDAEEYEHRRRVLEGRGAVVPNATGAGTDAAGTGEVDTSATEEDDTSSR